jgi:hypothetical protein
MERFGWRGNASTLSPISAGKELQKRLKFRQTGQHFWPCPTSVLGIAPVRPNCLDNRRSQEPCFLAAVLRN